MRPQRFSAQVAWTFATRLVMIASGVGASVIVAHWLGAEGLGALAVLNVTVAVALQIGSAGLPSANTYFIARDRKLLASIWANALAFALVAGCVLAIIIVLLVKLRPQLFGSVPPELLALSAASLPFQLVTLLGLNVLLGLGRVAHFNTLDAAAQGFALVNALFALVLLGAGLGTLVSLNVAAGVLVSLLVAWLIGRGLGQAGEGRALRPDALLFKRMARYGLKFHIAVLAGMLIFRADLLVVNHFRGATEAGVYAVASQVATMLMLLPSVIGTLLFPRLASVQDGQGEMAMRATRHTAFLMLLICAVAVPCAFALPLVYGAEFRDATPLLLILLPGIYLVSIESVLVQHFSSSGLPVAIPVFWLVTLGANVALNLWLVPLYGARAAAAVSSLSYALIFLLVVVYFLRETGNSLSRTLLVGTGELRELLLLARKG